MLGEVIGDRYRVLKLIGEGGMGQVYLAEHIYIEKKVALKLLRAEVLSNQEAVARFRQEARSASSIGHDNIISIDDFGMTRDGRVYMAMEFLHGEPLNELLAKAPLPLPRALDIMIQVGKGLSAAHAKGITHRDMKPENVFITNKEGRDVPKILDFGIAKVTGGDGGGHNLTVAGTIFGTPFYMAPEQAMGGKMDQRVDIYALGIILYEVFCGQVPFKADSFMGILTQHITTPPTPPSQMAAQYGRVCPPQLEAIINKAVQKDPNQRYQSMAEMTQALIELYRFSVGHGPSGPITMPRVTGKGQHVAGGRGRKPRAALFAGLGAAAVISVGAVVALRSGGSGASAGHGGTVRPATPDAGVGVKVAPPDAQIALNVGPPDAQVAVVAGPPDAPPSDLPPPRELVKVRVESRPSGAEVLVGRRSVCTTPCSVDVPKGDATRITLRKGGYQVQTFFVNGSEATASRVLTVEGLHGPE